MMNCSASSTVRVSGWTSSGVVITVNPPVGLGEPGTKMCSSSAGGPSPEPPGARAEERRGGEGWAGGGGGGRGGGGGNGGAPGGGGGRARDEEGQQCGRGALPRAAGD